MNMPEFETDNGSISDRPVSDHQDGHADPAAPLDNAAAVTGEIVEEAVRPWRPAECLKKLRQQVDAAFPGRKTGSDGTVGDPAHQTRASDHNPWITDGTKGVVSAMDITHDPASGCDAGKIVAALHSSRDKRIKYLIWNRRIANSSPIGTVPAWTWRSYTGSNPHNHHLHLSVKPLKELFDDTSDWAIQDIGEATSDGGDSDRQILAALAALGQAVDMAAPALPQLVGMQDALTQLFENMVEDCRRGKPNND